MEEKWLIGADLGGTTTKLAFVRGDGELLHKWEIRTDHSSGGKNILKNISQSVKEKLSLLGQPIRHIEGIGIGAPGPVDVNTGILHNVPNLPWKDDYPLKEMLEKEMGLPVRADNDANCAALGEMWRGAGIGADNLICVTIGTGIGGGVIANGRIVHGSGGAAGEIGHFSAITAGGARCNCGKTGCLETIASATGIIRQAKEVLNQPNPPATKLEEIYRASGAIAAKDVFDAAISGDPSALSIVENAAFYLGLALANASNILNPEKVVLGGGVSNAGEFFMKLVIKSFRQFAFPRVFQTTAIELASLGNNAGVIGAAGLLNHH